MAKDRRRSVAGGRGLCGGRQNNAILPGRICSITVLERSARRSEPVSDWRRPTGKCIKEVLAPLQDLNKDSVIIIIMTWSRLLFCSTRGPAGAKRPVAFFCPNHAHTNEYSKSYTNRNHPLTTYQVPPTPSPQGTCGKSVQFRV
jgi:hypothetical protein